MNQNLLYVLLLLVAYTILNKTSEKFIEYLSEDPLCPILKDEWVEKNCGNLFGIGYHEDCPRIKEEAEKLGCKLE